MEVASDLLQICLVFGWLEVLQLLRISSTCRTWQNARMQATSWEGLRLSAQQQLRARVGQCRNFEGAACYHGDINLLTDGALLFLAKSLMEVARATLPVSLEMLPGRPSASKDEGNINVYQASQMEICRYCFHLEECWFFQYNTFNYGWFHREHLYDIPCGLKVWAPSVVMAQHFSSPNGLDVRGKKCLELGAGVGLLSIFLASQGATVIASDTDELCLRVARVNVELNGFSESVVCQRLDFGCDSGMPDGSFDYIFGADITYVDKAAEAMFDTASQLLGANGCLFLGFVQRHNIRTELHRMAREAGFSWDPPRQIGREWSERCIVDISSYEQRAGAKHGEWKDVVDLYRFVRRGSFRIDDLD